MANRQIKSFGSWPSPISSNSIVSASVGLGTVTIDGSDIYWLEARPTEGGRNVIVRRNSTGQVGDVTPPPYNVRTRVHEYGGGAFLIVDSHIYFSNFADQRIYHHTLDTTPQPLTPESKLRFADYTLDKKHNRIICVCEDHSQTDQEPENKIVAVDLISGEVVVLITGNDFYTCPRLNPEGDRLAFISWDHPHMPWDQTTLSVATINSDGSIGEIIHVNSGFPESVCELKWSPKGVLHFCSDRSGWWNIYRHNSGGSLENLHPKEAEFGYPHWVFGESVFDFASETQIICSYSQNGRWFLADLNTETQQLKPIEVPYTQISHLQVKNHQAVFLGSSPTETNRVVKLDLNTHHREVLKAANNLNIKLDYISIPEAVAFPTENGLTAHAWFYPPTNCDCMPPQGSLPPLVVRSHGGPTAATAATLNLKIQYWTSRGFAVLDVNYGGSTGYGRPYRQRLNNNWGIVDVDDCVNGAKYLVAKGKVNPQQLAIAGGSAGGYTTLAALTFKDTFKAGASYYGISDLEALVRDTHKFESRYLDGLIGAYPAQKEIYQQRSPIHHTQNLSCPVIFFQGLEDRVVPPSQAEVMVEVLEAKGLPVAYVAFEGEQHGFRKAENIKRALEGEYYFYTKIFGIETAETIEPVKIANT